MDIKRKIILKTIIPIVIFIIILSFSYAIWFIIRESTETNRLSVLNCLNISLTDETNSINLLNAFPISTEEGMQLEPYTFTVKNECNTDIYVDLLLGVLPISDLLPEYVRVSINEVGEISDNSQILSENNIIIPILLEDAISYGIKKDIELVPNQSKAYDLRIWVDEATTMEQGAGKIFHCKCKSIPGIIYDSPLGIKCIMRQQSPYIAAKR